jgi:hypothetical protein
MKASIRSALSRFMLSVTCPYMSRVKADSDKKAKADRASAIEKAHALIRYPQKYNKYNTHGAAKYIQHIEFDKQTGEILQPQSILSFNEKVLAEEEKYDGYYVGLTERSPRH